jgi:hypothetical protein
MWSISEFTNYSLKDRQIIKPRIQRQKRWLEEDNKHYIQFLLRWKHSVMPFLLNEKIVDSRRIYYLFDGNNRANAILDFILKPLSVLPEVIPDGLPYSLKKYLKEVPLDTLLKSRYTLSKLYRDLPPNDEYDELKETKITEEDENAFESMLEVIAKWKFFDIHLSVTIKMNLSDEDMCSLYTSINKGGKILSKQELLAGSTFHIKFSKEDLPLYFDRLIAHLSGYYGKMSDNEKLMIENSGTTTITLFEVLVGFQLYLSEKYRVNDKKSFVQEYTGESNKDVVFSLYEHLGGSFDTVESHTVYSILQQIDYGFDTIVKTYECLYDSAINVSSLRDKFFYPSLHKNVALLLCMYAILNKGKDIRAEMKRLCAFHDLMSIKGNAVKDKDQYASDPLEYRSGGAWMPQYIRKLKDKKTFESIPSVDDVVRLIRHRLAEDTKHIQKRKPVTMVKALSFSAFYGYQIPSHRKAEPHDIDHIIPFSTKSKDAVDICRLGNLQLIPSCLNQSRGNKPICDVWITEHDLSYQHYPSQTEYELICISKHIISSLQYNELCDRREELYIKQLRRLFT